MAEGDSTELKVVKPKKSVDLATIVGLIGGFALIITAMFLGGSPMAFVDIPSILIVILGSTFITAVSFTLGEMLKTGGVLGKAVFQISRDPSEAALQMIQLSEMARKKGVLGLQGVTEELKEDAFLYKGMSMVVDGSSGDEVESVMRREMRATKDRHEKATGVLKRAAEVSPAMGLIGTLIGLVQMLGNLDDPSSIGPAMAVALLTTMYGAVMANMVWSPLAAKLERNSDEEALVNNIFTVATASIGRQENPRRLEMLLNSMLPPPKRVQYFD